MAQNVDFSAYDKYIDDHFDELVAELRAFCAQPTLAGQGIGLTEGVALVRDALEPLGATVREVPIADTPSVLIGELGSGDTTVLLYNHYDVQPPEPLELWESPPYAGDVRDGKFYARGVADDRGDLLSRVQAIRAFQATIGELPLRLRWLIEGEEEVGSPHIGPVIAANAADLKADWCLWESSGRDTHGRPIIVCGMKGILYVELHAQGPDHDAHSGAGGILPNPAWRLVMALASMRDDKFNFVLDGLDELVQGPTEADLAAAEAMPIDVDAMQKVYGVKNWQRGLKGRDVMNAMMFEPTANIAGFLSGYTGEGQKTIVPSTAMVKMDFRLVPNQTSAKMLELLRAHLDRRGFDDVEIRLLSGGEVGKTAVDSPVVLAARDTWLDMGEKEVVVEPSTGGSGPISYISGDLGIPTVMTGGPSYPGARVHSPNENIRLDDYKRTLHYFGRLLVRLAAMQRQ